MVHFPGSIQHLVGWNIEHCSVVEVVLVQNLVALHEQHLVQVQVQVKVHLVQVQVQVQVQVHLVQVKVQVHLVQVQLRVHLHLHLHLVHLVQVKVQVQVTLCRCRCTCMLGQYSWATSAYCLAVLTTTRLLITISLA